MSAAPKPRGRDAARRVEILLTEDAQPASVTDRSGRRLFDRLMAIGVAREHFGFGTLRDLPDVEQLEDAWLLSKQKLPAGALLGDLGERPDLIER